ncbi:F-type H+-transporting ATPase subunit gamma [Prosthecobacter fusiformis]|uniref:ATP synthase gamma chain n=1 Tax=Prosthecobacter fusiformis TaxID=48464 RepID=A0A4R7RM79_9BACT|nr:ATP synthase F1 subunit gamma [Prosthecobacter fusiformis]TDU64603.1 F-type H+-transporting ATPase subunit gamma [Prosthecobacter fusiformis]
MPSTRDIRRRIKSVKNTAQITKAMQLVAAAKMKKAQDQASNGRAYAELMNKILVSLKTSAEEGIHPFFSEGAGNKTLVLVIATDKGLCGALNTNLLKKLVNTPIEGEVEYVTIGRKASMGLSRLRKTLIADFPIKDPAKFVETRVVGKFLQEKFLTGEYKKVLVAFNNYINVVTQVPSIEQVLPVNPVTLGGKRNFDETSAEVNAADVPDYTFEPDAATVFETVLPQYVNGTIFQMVLEARASEHSSRMVAMKNATDNAKQMLKDLSLEYNKLRQAAITNELLEITTAKMALE